MIYPTPLLVQEISPHALFLKTLRAGGGIAVLAVTFFPTARTPTASFFAAEAAFLVFFTMVVPVEMAEMLLWLLTFLTSSDSLATSTPRFGLTAAAFVVVGLVALRPPAAFGRPGLAFSFTMLARSAVAAAAAALAGDANLIGEIGFRGDVGSAKCGFCGDLSSIRTGDWGRVRELADFGERTVEGFVA